MKKPIIGITCSEGMNGKNEMQFVNNDYIEAIVKAGGIPILLAICDVNIMSMQIQHIDGLLVTGGIDVNPLFYNETCHFLQGESSAFRDHYEIALIQEVANMKKPILGICRGQQVINVAFGGSLFQDNTFASEYVQQHTQKEKKQYPSHSIRMHKESFLTAIFGDKAFVNSFHHQSIKKVAEGFEVVARSEDSIIEAIEHKELPIWAVQFHPEKMKDVDVKMQMIFDEFIKKCQK